MRAIALSACLLLPTLLATPAHAETLSRTLSGKRLDLRLSCVKSVDIQPSDSLQGKIQVEASADRQDELTPLSFTEGETAGIERKGNCSGLFERPTLTISIKVPSATPIALDAGGSGSYRIGPVGAALKIGLSGSGDLEAANSTDLDLRLSGSGSLRLQRLDGPGRIEVYGSGAATLDAVAMPSLSVTVHGSGDIKVGPGDIGTLDASLTGSGMLRVAGTVKDATLSTTGSGMIDIAKATGAVHQHKTGSGRITVGS